MDRTQEIRSQVTGFLVPIFQEQDPYTGAMMHGLAPHDFEKVREGFACAGCLAEFRMYTIKCPACGKKRDLEADIRQAPQLWQDHLDERNADSAPYKPPVVNPFEDAYAQVLQDRDVEHIPLSKLGKRKWGRGR